MKNQRTTAQRPLRRTSEKPLRLPFIEHLLELRRRLFYVAVSVLVWSTAAYFVEHQIIDLIMAPAHGQKFIYTSVGGGLDFLFRVCLYVGIVMSLPVIIYQVLRYLQPLIGKHPTRFILLGSLTSGVLALAGVLFGYLVGLPAALKFLLNQFHTSDISALITIQSYLHFVIVYLVGSSLMFQVPLVIFFINRLKPLRVRTLLKYERWVVLVSIIAAAAINPSPRVGDLALLAVPMILSYQVGVAVVWYVNRRSQRPAQVQKLLEHDVAVQREREQRLQTVEYIWKQSDMALSLAPLPSFTETTPKASGAPQHHKSPVHSPVKKPVSAKPRSQKYVNDFIDLHGPRHPRPM